MQTVVALCNRTINMVQPWLDAGYRAVTVDLQRGDGEHPNRVHVAASVLALDDGFAAQFDPVAVFAFPPCTNLAVSGARWFKDKGLTGLINGLQLVEKCRRICEASGAPWMLENPVSTMATYWRQPDHSFDPCDYGDPYTKRTCIWTGGGFAMPPIVKPGDMLAAATWVEPTEGSMIHLMPPSADRGDLRSVTPQGFADAVFRANSRAPALQAAE